MDSEKLLGVEQRHRDAAAAFYGPHLARPGEVAVTAHMRAGKIDESPLIQAFARFERDLVPENGLREALERANEKVCMDCAGHNPVWFAPNKVWNLVIGGPDANDDPGGFYCPVCFIRRAEASGFVPTGWELRPEEIDGETHLQARNEGVEEPQGTAAHVRGKDHQAAPGSAAAETEISARSALQHNTGERDELPDDVRALVIAAREFWDIHDSPVEPESRALDQALEAFAGRVPFADEPALSQAPR